jgi:uncharacterized protein (DUF362 family)
MADAIDDAASDFRVLVKQCPEYDAERIRELVAEGMRELDFEPRGRVAFKPNVVCAFDPALVKERAFTPTEFLEGTIRAVDAVDGVERMAVTETSAVGNPTRFSYRWSGYRDSIAALGTQTAHPLSLVCMDEVRRVPRWVGGVVHDRVRLARSFAEADTKIYVPKLKCHCVTRMTGTVKLNIGILSFDERSIRHDFMLHEKIADLLAVGWPDFTVMDAITVGVGNEGVPIPRPLGLVLMGRNPIAVDLVGCRLLGLTGEREVGYLKAAIERGYRPARTAEVELLGDATSLEDIDELAKRVQPYDEEFHRWQDVNRDLERLRSPLRLYHGPYAAGGADKCETGCVMGLKMLLGFLESYAGTEAFEKGHPGVFIIGRHDEEIDAMGGNAFIIGSCSEARVINARKVLRIDKCFTTSADMFMTFGARLGMPSPFLDRKFLGQYVPSMLAGTAKKLTGGRYADDAVHFVKHQLLRKL